jgi:hypothetical protein
MRKMKFEVIVITSFTLLVVLGMAHPAIAQDAAPPYTGIVPAKMAPVEQYLMTDQDAEIALARTAAPESSAVRATRISASWEIGNRPNSVSSRLVFLGLAVMT